MLIYLVSFQFIFFQVHWIGIIGLATRIRFRTPEQMEASANTTKEQSNKKRMEVGDPRMAEMEE